MQQKKRPNKSGKDFEKNTSESTIGINDAKRNEILEEHARKFPEGDPSVRRKNPDKGKIW